MQPPTPSPADEPNPALIFETLNAHQRSAALRGAIELDVFTTLADGQLTAGELAARASADARAMRILCDYLVVHGFLAKYADTYALTPTSAVFLNRSSPQYMGSIARFINSDHQLEAFRDVAALVRRGGTLLGPEGTTATEYEGWVEFARCMVPMMMPAAEFLAGLVAERYSGPIRVLDIAAGHGMFGISVARRNPRARIVALDWSKVLEVAVENAGELGVEDRYETLEGDATKIDYGQGFDVVLITNFLHHFDVPTCISMLQRIRDSLSPHGTAFTLEFVPNDDRVSPPASATFSFTMFGTTPAGDAYTFGEYDRMFQEAGFGESRMIDVPDSPQRVIVTRR